MPTEPKNPLFPPISQQPSVGIFSTHANRLARCQSIHWSCLLTFKIWAYPEITHISPTAMTSQQPTVGNSSTHENRLTRCQSIHWHYLLAVGVQNPSSIVHISVPSTHDIFVLG